MKPIVKLSGIRVQQRVAPKFFTPNLIKHKIQHPVIFNKTNITIYPTHIHSFVRFSSSDPTKQIKQEHARSVGHSEHDIHHPLGGVHGAKHQLQHRVKEKVGMKVAEKTIHVLPRLLRIKKRLGTHLIARKLLRGVAIAVPAIGGIFACIVTYTDSKRALLEQSRGNTLPAGLFGLAAVCDIIDAAAHLYTASGLLGIHAGHVHTAEELSLVVAVIATSAAIAGEWYTPTPTEQAADHLKHTPGPDSPQATHEGHHHHKSIVGHTTNTDQSQVTKNAEAQFTQFTQATKNT